ncbi:hypothetical protein PIROE2DRAFT_6041 [Piromyces sp. E2]|nr:hypothetical protein PIROE2DRAFT_6041 [Piromyces sp. E2]|eukprot:OUM66625.1 hypothetical protein PIROE2DRAFT_6041 [Piromyces sp. E2]
MVEAGNHFKNTNINKVLGQTVFFFVGILICSGLEYIVNKLNHSHSSLEIENFIDIKNERLVYEQENGNGNSDMNEIKYDMTNLNNNNSKDDDPREKSKSTLINILVDEDEEEDLDGDLSNNNRDRILSHRKREKESKMLKKENTNINLQNIGILTAFIITLHNIPEGVVTFTSNLTNVNIGLILTKAIAIHNIPEGFSVAFPIYYSSGSRGKAFLWGGISGLSEVLAASIVYLVLKLFSVEINNFTPMIIRREIETKYGFLSGMLTMAISLVLLDN